MNDVILRYVAELRAEGGQVPVVVLAVVKHFPFLSRAQTVERVHER